MLPGGKETKYGDDYARDPYFGSLFPGCNFPFDLVYTGMPGLSG